MWTCNIFQKNSGLGNPVMVPALDKYLECKRSIRTPSHFRAVVLKCGLQTNSQHQQHLGNLLDVQTLRPFLVFLTNLRGDSDVHVSLRTTVQDRLHGPKEQKSSGLMEFDISSSFLSSFVFSSFLQVYPFLI